MALKQKLVINNIECEYWRIVGFNTSLTGKLCQIFLLGYITGEDRQENRNIASKNYNIKKEEFDNYIYTDEEYNIVSNLYGYLKEKTEEFKDAVDV